MRRARTISLVRILRAMPLRQRRARMPRQLQPDLVRTEYYNAILPFVREALREFHKVRGEIVGMLRQERAQQASIEAKRDTRLDANARERQAQQLIDRAAARAAAAFEPTQLRAVAERFGRRTSDFQKGQLDRQVRAATGVPLAMLERPIVGKLEGFAAENVELIKTVSSRYFDRLRTDVTEAFESGMHPTTLAKNLMERDGMAENDALRIARDQIGKLNGQLNEARQTALGVSKYRWRGMMDNRERDEHREREGEIFEWSDPPEGGHPGEDINCRCWAEPVLDEIIESIDA